MVNITADSVHDIAAIMVLERNMNKSVRIQIRLPVQLVDHLKHRAAELGLPLHYFILVSLVKEAEVAQDLRPPREPIKVEHLGLAELNRLVRQKTGIDLYLAEKNPSLNKDPWRAPTKKTLEEIDPDSLDSTFFRP